MNEQIPLDLNFRDETGKTVRLREYFGEKPVILVLAYYECPMLCTQVLNGLTRSLQGMTLDVGKQFNVVTVSINPRETPELAFAKKRIYAGIYGRPLAEQGWHFLTGDQPSIQELARAVGFRYAFDPESGQYAHASGIMVLTPEGRLSRYFYGIQYHSRDLRLSLVEASAGKDRLPGGPALAVLLPLRPGDGKVRAGDSQYRSRGRPGHGPGDWRVYLGIVAPRTEEDKRGPGMTTFTLFPIPHSLLSVAGNH